MIFSILHPVLCPSSLTTLPGWEGVQTLLMDCPVCRQQFSILVRQDGLPDATRAIWTLSQPPGNSSWAAVSLAPSIIQHPVTHNRTACPAHFSVANGQVVLH